MSSVGRVNVKRERGGGLLLKNRSNEFECGKKKVDLILDTCVGSLGYGQCDQMVKFCVMFGHLQQLKCTQ